MSEKTFDELFPEIQDDGALEFTRAELNGVRVALRWLDQHSDRVPGRTMTESEYLSAVDAAKEAAPNDLWWQGRAILSHAEVKIVDPEPTNREKISEQLVRAKVRAGAGVHHLTPDELHLLAEKLDELGVIAP